MKITEVFNSNISINIQPHNICCHSFQNYNMLENPIWIFVLFLYKIKEVKKKF